VIRKKGREMVNFWRMFRVFSKTRPLLVVDEGNIRNGRKKYKVLSKSQIQRKKCSNHAWIVRKCAEGQGFAEKIPPYCGGDMASHRGISADRFDTPAAAVLAAKHPQLRLQAVDFRGVIIAQKF
jgi:hypothetical protein